MLLNMEQLTTLVAFADSGSVKGAAALVHKTPSAVSVQLAKLTQVLGRELLQRQGRRLLLNHDGVELVRYARRLLAVQAEALAFFQVAGIVGSLRIGLPDDYSPLLMTLLLAQLGRIAPQVYVEVFYAPSAELRPMLRQGQLDLAILSAETDSQEGVILRTEPVVWIGSSQHETWQQPSVPLALFPEGCIFRKWALSQLQRSQRECRIACTSHSISAIQAAVASGFALSVVAESGIIPGIRRLTEEQGYAALPDVTIILAASPGNSRAEALARRLAEPIRASLQAARGAWRL